MNPNQLHNATERGALSAEVRQSPPGRETMRSLGHEAFLASEIYRVQPETFTDVYPASKIKNDLKYAAKYEQRLSDAELNSERTARVFEDLMIEGVQRGNWFGNAPNTGEPEPFRVVSRSASRYDDLVHRIDDFFTLVFPDSRRPVVFGVDTTVATSREAIMGKLTKSNNSGGKHAFGFSELNYYENHTGHVGWTALPRYVIGLNRRDAKAIARTKANDRYDLNSADNLKDRFKILSEIHAQNELFSTMLPPKNDKKYNFSRLSLASVERALRPALDESTRMLLALGSEAIPNDAIRTAAAEAYKSGDKDAAHRIIQDYLLAESEQKYQKNRNSRFVEQSAHDTFSDNYGNNHDPFVQIITCTRELREASIAGKLTSYREVGQHNQGFTLDANGEPIQLHTRHVGVPTIPRATNPLPA